MKYVVLGACVLLLIVIFSSMSVRRPPTVSNLVKEAFNKDGPKLSKKYGLTFLSRCSEYSLKGQSYAALGLNVSSQSAMTKEEVREWVKPLLLDLWAMLHEDAIYLAFTIEDWEIRKIPEKPFTPAVLGLKLSFWNKEMDRRGFPYISLIKVMGKKIYYYHADPMTQKLQEPSFETFEEIGLQFPILETKELDFEPLDVWNMTKKTQPSQKKSKVSWW